MEEQFEQAAQGEQIEQGEFDNSDRGEEVYGQSK